MLDVLPISYMTQTVTSAVVRDNYPVVVLVFYSLFCNAMGTELGWDLGFGKLIVEGKDSSLIQHTHTHIYIYISWLIFFFNIRN